MKVFVHMINVGDMISKSGFEICPSDEGKSGRQPLRAAAKRLSAARRVFKHTGAM